MKKFFCFVFFLITTNVCNAQYFGNNQRNFWNTNNLYWNSGSWNWNNPYWQWSPVPSYNPYLYNNFSYPNINFIYVNPSYNVGQKNYYQSITPSKSSGSR
jgi:hypothetical protein